MQLDDAQFDLAISTLSLIDIPAIKAARAKNVKSLKPGGQLRVSNLTNFSTANDHGGWNAPDGRAPLFTIDNCLDE